jgi:hypothetical protein
MRDLDYDHLEYVVVVVEVVEVAAVAAAAVVVVVVAAAAGCSFLESCMGRVIPKKKKERKSLKE